MKGAATETGIRQSPDRLRPPSQSGFLVLLLSSDLLVPFSVCMPTPLHLSPHEAEDPLLPQT